MTTSNEPHVHTDECLSEYRERVERTLDEFSDEKRELYLQSGNGAIDMIREYFPTATDEQRSDVLAFAAGVLGRLLTTPVALVSDAVCDSVVAYEIGAAALIGAVELPDREASEAKRAINEDDLREVLADPGPPPLPDDWRPGNYL